MTNLLAVLAAAFIAAPAAAGGLEGFYLPDASFAMTVNETVARYEAADALRDTPECGLLDRKYFRAFSLVEAVKALQPCVEGLSRRSGMAVKAEMGVVREATETEGPVMGIVLRTGDAPVTSQGMRDLNYSLRQRNFELLGHPVLVRRAGDEEAGRKSAAQEALDACVMTTVLRKIETSAEFISSYGRCITADKGLKVKDLRPAPNRELGVLALSGASDVVVQSLNGSVRVNTIEGPVTVLIIAYPETYSLPK